MSWAPDALQLPLVPSAGIFAQDITCTLLFCVDTKTERRLDLEAKGLFEL